MKLKEKLGTWYDLLKDEFNKDYMLKLREELSKKRQSNLVFPEPNRLFRCFRECPLNELKVVFLGFTPHAGYIKTPQDNKIVGHADGMFLSCDLHNYLDMHWVQPAVNDHVLGRIESDYEIEFPPIDPDLKHWANQGVLLYDVIQTTDAGQYASHKDIGWEEFSKALIKKIREVNPQMTFIIFGRYAEKVFDSSEVSKRFAYTVTHPQAYINSPNFVGKKFDTRFLKDLQQTHNIKWI